MGEITTVGVEKSKQEVSKLLVVGNVMSSLEVVVEIMIANGLKYADSLAKEKISPDEISKLILKAHGIGNDSDISEQLEVSPIWNALALDLMMSNLDSSKWIWSDSNANILLDYWHSLDKSIGFVLVYNSPTQHVEKLLESGQVSTVDEINKALEEWYAYNKLLLNYFYAHQDIAILVNSEQVQDNSTNYITEIRKQISLEERELSTVVSTIKDEEKNSSSIIYNYLANEIVDTNETVKMLYLEMESIANIPLSEVTDKPKLLDDLLGSYLEEKSEYAKLNLKFEKLQSKNELAEIELESLQESFENHNYLERRLKEISLKLEAEKTNTEKARNHKNYLKNKLENKILEEQNENELVLLELMKVQEEFEKVFLTNKSLEKKLSQINLNLNTEKENTQKARSHKNHLKAQLEERLAEERQKVKKLQHELDRYVQESSELKKEKQYYGAVERVKQQLSYKLGEKLVELGRSWYGVFLVPYALYSISKQHKREAKNYAHLPPVEFYADFHEAEKLKRYLPYKLGQAVAQSKKSILFPIKLPFALYKTYRKHREERKSAL